MPDIDFSALPWTSEEGSVFSADGTLLFKATAEANPKDISTAAAAPEMFRALREIRHTIAGYMACGDQADQEALYRALDHAEAALHHAHGPNRHA